MCQWWTATYLRRLPWSYAVHGYPDSTSTPFPSRYTGTQCLHCHWSVSLLATNRRHVHSIQGWFHKSTVSGSFQCPCSQCRLCVWHSQWVSDSKSCQWLSSPSERRCLRWGSSNLHWLHRRSNCLLSVLNLLAYYCGSNLKRTMAPASDAIVDYVLRVRTLRLLHSTHAWSVISSWIILGLCFPYNLFNFCINHCVCASYCEVNQI